jgi:hypothetical protein
MKFIAHRGNIDGPSEEENSPQKIDISIDMGYDVEIDIRYDSHTNSFGLGHDKSDYDVTWDWLEKRKSNLWIHCKDINSLYEFTTNPLGNSYNYFWHQNDDFTLTSKNYIWTYPGKTCTDNSIVVMTEWDISIDNISKITEYKCFGICSDYVRKLSLNYG